MSGESIQAVHHEYVGQLMAIAGVVGVGVGECSGRPCLKIFVVKKTPALAEQIPGRLRGYELRVEETGEFRPLGVP
jgi:hypothetical protein